MVMTLLVHDGRGFDGRDLVDDQLARVPHSFAESPALGGVAHGLVDVLPPLRRLRPGLVPGGSVEVLPRLAVVPVQASSALGAGGVVRRDGVAVRRRSVAVMSGTSVPGEEGEKEWLVTRRSGSGRARSMHGEGPAKRKYI